MRFINMKEQMEKFYGKIWKITDSFVITIPKTLIDFSGFEKGDQVELYIRKRDDSLEPKETTKETTEKEED